MPSRRARVWSAVVVACVAIGTALPAYAEPDPEQAAISADATSEIQARVRERIADARGKQDAAERAYRALLARADDAKSELRALSDQSAAAQARVLEFDDKLQNKDEAVGEMRRQIEQAAAALWRAHAGTSVDESPSDAYVDSVRRDTYGRSAGEVPRELVQQYQQERKAFELLRNRADDERAEIERKRQSAERVVTDLERLSSTALSEANLATARLARWEALVSAPATPVRSASLLSAPEIAGWFKSTGMVARLGTDEAGGPMTIDKLADYFVDEGKRYGIRADVAFAQAIHETGYFSFPSYGQVRPADNNFAGIGACNSCERGYQYPNARIGARAQMQLLRNYSDPQITAATLPGGDKPLFANFDRFGLRGIATVWTDLNGRWAVPGSTYGQAIHRTYLRMYAWAVENMTVAPLAPPPVAAVPSTATTTTVPDPATILTRPATPVAR
ncbi:MAG: glucosaminidase domain-containing protein [Acidimicrobiia bacterium]